MHNKVEITMYLKISNAALVTVLGMFVLSGCGSDSGDEDVITRGEWLPGDPSMMSMNWVPRYSEGYDGNGKVIYCTKTEIDSGGRLLSSLLSVESDNEPLECSTRDEYHTYTEYTYNTDHTEISTSDFSYDGSHSCTVSSLTSAGLAYRVASYNSESEHNTCSPESGVLSSLRVAVIEDDFFQIKEITYNSAGSDGQWETEDDRVMGQAVTEWSDDRLYSYTTYYSDAGDDNVWSTEDDVAQSTIETVFKEVLIPALKTFVVLGEDGDEDEIIDYTLFIYENETIKREEHYASAGADGLWETVEDNLKLRVVFY